MSTLPLQPLAQQSAQLSTSNITTAQHLGVFAFGVIILFMVGFASMPQAHNAAHDTRHAMAFPCH